MLSLWSLNSLLGKKIPKILQQNVKRRENSDVSWLVEVLYRRLVKTVVIWRMVIWPRNENDYLCCEFLVPNTPNYSMGISTLKIKKSQWHVPHSNYTCLLIYIVVSLLQNTMQRTVSVSNRNLQIFLTVKLWIPLREYYMDSSSGCSSWDFWGTWVTSICLKTCTDNLSMNFRVNVKRSHA